MIGPFYFTPFHDKVLVTNDAGRYIFLSQQEFDLFTQNDSLLDPILRDRLETDGFCYSDSVESFIRYNRDAIREANGYLFTATNLFIFAITNSCNNRCLYCQANGTNEIRRMSNEVAEAALQKIKNSPSHEVIIEFQGGEPLLNFPVMQYIITRGRTLLSNKNVRFTVVSNLSLITDEITRFFRDNNVSVSTSLDGPCLLHDINRPDINGNGTYHNTIRGIKVLRDAGIFPGAIQTTTKQSLSFAEDIVDEYIQQGFRQIFLRPLTRLGAAARCWDRIGYNAEEYLSFYRRALNKIIEYHKKGIYLKEYCASLFLSKMLYGRSVNYMELRSPCGAGIGQMAITANGNVYSCDEGRMMAEMGDEAFRLGNVFDDSYDDWINSSTCQTICSASLLESLPGCCDCVYKPYCGVCPVINYALYGNVTHVSSERCKIYKGIIEILFELINQGDKDIYNMFEEWGGEA